MKNCAVCFSDDDNIFVPTDPAGQKGMGAIFSCCIFKKCCKKYKKGKRCKDCPGKKK